MVDGVGDDHVVPDRRSHVLGQQTQAVRLAEPGLFGRTVHVAALPRPDPSYGRLGIRSQLDQAVVTGVGDQEAAARECGRLGREAEVGLDRLRRDVGAVAALKRAALAVLVDQLREQASMACACPSPAYCATT